MEDVLSFNRVGIAAWWLNGRVLRKTTFGIWQIKMLNLLAPMFRLLDRWLPLPPLSLIAILRRSPAAVRVASADETQDVPRGHDASISREPALH